MLLQQLGLSKQLGDLANLKKASFVVSYASNDAFLFAIQY
mgnify:CR=1 FL=1